MSVTERMKKVLSILLCLCMVLSYVPTTAFAAAEDGLCEHHAEHTAECGYVEGVSDCTYHCDTCLGHSHEEDVEEPTTEPAPVPTTEDTTLAPTTAEHVYVVKMVTSAPESDLPGNDELFAMYAEQKLYGYEWSAFGTKAGEALTGDEKLVYDALIPYIKGIAAGTRSSAVVGLGQTLENVDMGDGPTTYTADTAVTFTGTYFSKEQLDSVASALLADYPYEMYWYDKVTGTEIEVIAGETLAHLRVSMTVAANYRTDTYSANTAKTSAAAAAAAKAQSVISANAGKSDYEKLAAYKNWICDNVSYNTAAENKDFTTNSDPWQLIYVFDGDSNTNVVCEGYSKAFQYLCDLGGLDCICADGTMTGGTGAGPHMWNVVTLDGKNYLVDVTNCDEGTVGAPDALFLVGGTYAEGGYSYTIGSQTVTYTCADLSLAATHYDTGAQTPDPVCTCESKCSEGSVNSTCVICSAEGADLTACTGKVAEVRTVYVGGVELNVGEYLAVDGTDGAAEKPEGGYAYLYADGEKLILELNNYDNKGGSKGASSYSAAIWSDHALTIDLKGENTLTNTAASGDGIYAGADLTISGTGKLTVEAGTMGIYCAPVDYRQSATVRVTGGYLFLNVKTYGIWAGAVEISGGEIVCTNTAELNNMIKAVPGDGNGNAHPGYLKADAHTTIVTNCEHVFSTEWATNETHHWHSCTVSGCATIHNPAVYSQLENAQYGEHEFDPTTGKCACGEELAVASVTVGSTTTYYETLPAAVTAARASENSTLTLLKDIDLGGEDLLITSGTFTIDLNDCTYTSTCLSAIRVEGATVTITDNGPNKTGTVQGEFNGVEVTNYGTVNITGGTITAQTGIFSYICGTINISGGTVIGTGTSTDDAAVMSYGSDSMVNITGGSISGTERDLYISSASLKLTLAKGKTEGARFPGGITVHGKTLAELLSDTVAYWAVVDGKDTMLAVADDATGITDKGDITIRAACGHGDAEYAPNADGTTHTWTCGVCQTVVTEEHSTGAEGDKALTCTMPAYCSVCESEYGEPVGHNWVNGFCTNEIEGVVCDDYEPATPVTNENYAELGLSTGYIGYYAIENAGQLYWFAEKVDNENDTYKTANVVLTANINVNVGGMNESTTGAREWNPIGYWNSGRDYAAFNGTFDGNNKKISGLYVNNTDNTAGKSVALIAETESGALVKNVTVTNTWFHGYAQVAGIVGDNGGTITGCVSEASLSCTWSYIGGMAGWNEGTITGCINRGTIAGKYNNSGGIAGHNAGTVELCGNEGNISDDWCFAGGIAGNNAGTIRNCWNTGEIYVTNTIAGGIAGKNNPDDLLENCWSTGTVSCGRDPEAAGGIVGLCENATQRNCYSVMKPVGVIEDEGGVSTVENMDQITLDQLASGEVAYLLRTRAAAGTDVWGQNIDNGQHVQTVPVLNGADVYYGYIDCHSTEAKYTNTAVSVEPVEHSYDNGFCTNELTDGTVCDAYEPAVLVTAENREELGLAESYIGYYAINNGGNLYWFADKVDNENATYGSVNVVLTADVTVNEGTVTASSTGMRDWNPIGWFTDTSDDQAAFSGTFDGNGKSISGLYFNNIAINGVSLFAITGETALVKNVTVTNSYFCGNGNNSAVVAINYGTVSSCFNEATLSGYAQIGGIVGRNLGLVELCGNTGAITGDWGKVGGIVGDNKNTVRNCWNTGNIQADYNYVGGITGANNSSGTDRTAALTENCWSTGTVVSFGRTTAGGIVGAAWVNLGGVRNCYSLMKPVGATWNAHPVTNAEQKTLDQFASGEVAYLLRTRAAEGTDVWGQNIDNNQPAQTVPALNGADVYQVVVDCAGSLGYSNTNASKAVHNYDDNGFCVNENAEGGLCDAYEPAVPVTEDNYTELGLTADYVGYYAISNAGQLYWFADKVDNEHDTYGSVNVVLTDNITVNAGTVTAESAGMRAWTPIGDWDHQYGGTFDGNGKTVSGLYYNDNGNDNSRYVALISCMAESGVVKNVTVTNSVFIGYEFTAAIVGYNYGTVTGCVNNAPISGATYSAGIAANNRGTVELCGNTGTVYASWAVSGGVVARSLSNGPAQAAMVKNCWNTGNTSSENKTAGGIVGESSAQVSSYAYARVENCWSTGSVSAPEAVGGVTGDNWHAVVSNCYSVMAPVGVLEQGAYTSESEQKTLNQFSSGEVAYLLGGVWGQDLDNGKTVQTVPTFTGAAVYYGYTSCGSDAVEKYTNNENASATKPEHMGKINYTLTEDGTQHIGACDSCDTVFTEDHDFENEAHQCVCGKVETITITFDPANGEEKIVITQDYGSSITAPENPTREGFHFVKWDTDIPATMPAEDLTIKAVWEAHTLVYSVNGSTITVTCSANCGVTGTASITAESKTYDGTSAVVDCHCSGSVDPNEVSPSFTKDGRYVNGEDLAEAGTYTASITLGMGENAATASVDFTIAKKELTDTISGFMSKSYDGTNIVPEGHGLTIVLDGVISGDTVTASADFAFAGVNAGTKTINATNIALSGEDAANYALKTTTASADVGEIVVLDLQYLEPHDYEIVFGKEPVYNGKEQTMTVESFVMCGLDVTYELTGNTGTDAGFYTMVVTANGNFAGTITQDWQINKKAVTVTAKDQTVTYGETISGTEITADGLADGHSVTVTLTPSTANVTASGTITASAAIITADGTDVTSNYEIAYTNGKLVIEPDTSRIDGLTTENVTSANEEDIKAVQEVLEKADSLKDEWKDLATTCEDMIEKIEAVEEAIESVNEDAAAFDAETVNSADKEALEQLAEDIEALLDTDNLTKDERAALETVQEQVEGMIDTINETAEDSKAATDTIDALDPETVNSDDKDELEQAIDTIDELLKDDHLTEEERSALEGAKEEAEALIEVIDAAQDAANTDAIQKVEDVSAENVKPEDKEALEDAKADLEKALEDNADNYTEEEKKTIQEEIQRIEDAFEALENARDVTEAIKALPETVEPDDETAAEQILDAKKAYDELTDHEKSLVGEENKKKLDDMVAALIAYDIIKGDGGKWTQGSSSGLSFTANGPFSKFAGIEVDGKEVDEKYYEAKSGSTIITLKQSYLKKLSAGEHTITVLYTDGETSGTFKILEQSTSPATGDDFNIMLYGAMFTVSLAGLVVLLLAAKKRKRENA